MEYKYLFGSGLLKLENIRDEDWVVFVDKRASETRQKSCRSIPFHKKLIEIFMRGKEIKYDPFMALHLYQLSAPFREGSNYPFAHFNIAEHGEVWKRFLKAYINSEIAEQEAIRSDILPKNFYHILYQYYMIIEDTHWISNEAKVNVQKIHDLKMPSAYFYELRNLIDSL